MGGTKGKFWDLPLSVQSFSIDLEDMMMMPYCQFVQKIRAFSCKILSFCTDCILCIKIMIEQVGSGWIERCHGTRCKYLDGLCCLSLNYLSLHMLKVYWQNFKQLDSPSFLLLFSWHSAPPPPITRVFIIQIPPYNLA